jgi:alpha-L-fucosidase
LYVERMDKQLTELLTQYGKIPLVWFDFDGYPSPAEPQATAELVRKINPEVIITNRLEPLHSDESHALVGKWGDYATPEQFVGSYCDTQPWETCMTICTQWAWKPEDKLKSLGECLRILCSSAGGDGNLLLNVGPMPTGEIEGRQVARLDEIGAWIKRNGEAIYGTRGGPYWPTKAYAATRKGSAVYLHLYGKGKEGEYVLPALGARMLKAAVLGGAEAKIVQDDNRLVVSVPAGAVDADVTVVKLEVAGDALKIPVVYPVSTSGSRHGVNAASTTGSHR